VHPWPTDETHLSLEQRMELQQHLIALGLLEGEPDGVVGRGTLEAIKTYQRSKKLGVDGFPSLTLLKMIRSEAPPVPAAQPVTTGATPPAAATQGQPPAAASQPAAAGETTAPMVGQE
jgi:membrane-bound lytic murein transglycosylase B